MPAYKRVDEPRREHGLPHRVQFVRAFLGFDAGDVEAIHEVCPRLLPRLPAIVDAVYAKMLDFDATRRHLTARHRGYAGEVPATPEAVTAQHELLQFRKRALLDFFTNLLLSDFDATTVDWMDTVGRMHTTRAGNASIHVPLVQMNAMMGFMADLFLREVATLDLDADVRFRVARALSKLLWLQNDLLSRHYV